MRQRIGHHVVVVLTVLATVGDASAAPPPGSVWWCDDLGLCSRDYQSGCGSKDPCEPVASAFGYSSRKSNGDADFSAFSTPKHCEKRRSAEPAEAKASKCAAVGRIARPKDKQLVVPPGRGFWCLAVRMPYGDKIEEMCKRTHQECDASATEANNMNLTVSRMCQAVKTAWMHETYWPAPVLRIFETKAACFARLRTFGGENCSAVR